MDDFRRAAVLLWRSGQVGDGRGISYGSGSRPDFAGALRRNVFRRRIFSVFLDVRRDWGGFLERPGCAAVAVVGHDAPRLLHVDLQRYPQRSQFQDFRIPLRGSALLASPDGAAHLAEDTSRVADRPLGGPAASRHFGRNLRLRKNLSRGNPHVRQASISCRDVPLAALFVVVRDFWTRVAVVADFPTVSLKAEALLRDDHLGSALHCKTRGQEREQKLERVLHLNLDHAARTVGLARANLQVVGRSDPSSRGGDLSRIESDAGGQILDVCRDISVGSGTPAGQAAGASGAADAGPA